MKINTTYECEICGKVFSKKEDALECEKKHPELLGITGLSFEDRKGEKHPQFVKVDFIDGSKRVYKLYNETYSGLPNIDSWIPSKLLGRNGR